MEPHTTLRWIVFPSVLLGLLLHAYVCFLVPDGGSNGFTLGLFALSILPYLACLIVGTRSYCGQLMAACAILPLLLLDSIAFHEAFVDPSTSTSSLVLLIVPVANLVVLSLGFLAGRIVFTRGRRNTKAKLR